MTTHHEFRTLRAELDREALPLVALAGSAPRPQLRTAQFQGRQHLVVPVVALVGDQVVRPVGANGPEFVPARLLAESPQCWNGRPVLPDHPENGRASANVPSIYEREAFGMVFAGRYDAKRLKCEAWLDLGAATADPLKQSVIERCRAAAEGDGKPVEVSVGAWVLVDDTPGTAPDGTAYTCSWTSLESDHLAMLPADARGACSVAAGCGAPRMNKEDAKMAEDDEKEIRAAALSKARRPTFKGTSTGAWSAPSFKDLTGKTVADASPAEKAEAAAHSLLGDPKGDNERDVLMFPVVGKDGKLYAAALRAVLGGRGSQAKIAAAALSSAQDMASSLLKSEFKSDVKASEDRRSLLARIGGALAHLLRFDDNPTDTDMRGMLHQALSAMVPQFGGIVEHYPRARTAVYQCGSADGGSGMDYYTCGYRMNDSGDLSVDSIEQHKQVQPVMRWEPMPDADEETDDTANGMAPMTPPDGSQRENPSSYRGADAATDKEKTERAATCGCAGKTTDSTALVAEEKESHMADLKGLVDRLIAIDGVPFNEADKPHLLAMGEERVKQLIVQAEAAKKPRELTEEELPQELRSLLAAKRAAEKKQKDHLRALIGKAPAAKGLYTDEELAAKSVEELDKIARLAGCRTSPAALVSDFGLAGGTLRGAESETDEARLAPEPPNSYALAFEAKGNKRAAALLRGEQPA